MKTNADVLEHWRATRNPLCGCLYCKESGSGFRAVPFAMGSNYLRIRSENWRPPSGWPPVKSGFTAVGWFYRPLSSTQNTTDIRYLYWESMGCFGPPVVKAMLSRDVDGPSYSPVNAKTGFNCTRCNEKNDYASANQANGTYVCFNCR